MASGVHVMAQQKGVLETRIKTLVNPDLKEICKAYSFQVSGTKVVLQRRCLDILNDIVKKGDVNAFNIFSFRVQNHGMLPPQAQPCDTPQRHSSNANSQSAGARSGQTQGRLPGRGRYFKLSPFYEILDTVLPLTELQVGQEMPQNRHTVRPTLTLDETTVTNVKLHGMRLLLYCGLASQMSPYSPVDISFPAQIEVKINNDTQQHNFKGLKNKPGTTKPADITDLVRVQKGYANQLSITYALTPKKYALVVHLAHVISADVLTERVKTANVIPKDRVLEDMRRANDDPDIAATSIRMSLKDPVSTMRISLPVRSSACSHNQCFDAGMFLQMMAQAPTWSCPICSKTISFDSLCVDKYFQDILNRTSRSIDKIDIEPNGEWTVIKEEEDATTNGLSSKPRASYDDDFDDDIIEVADVPSKGSGTTRLSLPLSNGFQHFPINTPPVSSRETSAAQSAAPNQVQRSKRPVEAVIDLTLDDSDDDQPPRPAKRQTTSNSTVTRPTTQPPTPVGHMPQNGFHYNGDNFRTTLPSLPNAPCLSSDSNDGSSPFINTHSVHGPRSPAMSSNGTFSTIGTNQFFQPPPPPPSSQYSHHHNYTGSFSLPPPSAGLLSGPSVQQRPGPPPTQNQSQSDVPYGMAQMRGWRGDFSNSSSPG